MEEILNMTIKELQDKMHLKDYDMLIILGSGIHELLRYFKETHSEDNGEVEAMTKQIEIINAILVDAVAACLFKYTHE